MKRSIAAALFLLAGQMAFAGAMPEMILMGKGQPTRAPGASAGFNALAGALKKDIATAGASEGSVHANATGKNTIGPDPVGHPADPPPPGPERSITTPQP